MEAVCYHKQSRFIKELRSRGQNQKNLKSEKQASMFSFLFLFLFLNRDTVWDWPGSVDGRHDAERGVENLEVDFVLNLGAPAGPRQRHYGDADEIPGDIGVEGDGVAQVGLNHGTLSNRGNTGSC